MAYLIGCPSYLFIALCGIMKRLPGMWSLMSIMDLDRLLGSCLLEFLSLASCVRVTDFVKMLFSMNLPISHIGHIHCSGHVKILV